MKQLFISLLLILAVIIATNPLSADWVQTNGPFGGQIKCFAVSESKIFAGTYCGVFLSTNYGVSWTAVNNGLPGLYVNALAVCNGNIIAGIQDRGVYISKNNGLSWSESNNGLSVCDLRALAVKDGEIFAGGWNGVYHSTDEGASWSAVNSPDYEFHINVLAINNDKLYAGTRTGFVYTSTDNGNSWEAVFKGSSNDRIESIGFNPDGIFVGVAGHGGFSPDSIFPSGIYFTPYNSLDWKEIYGPWMGCGAHSFALIDNNFYAATISGLCFKTSNDKLWSKIPIDLPEKDLMINALAVCDGRLFAGTRIGGVLVSTDKGKSWSSANNGLISTGVSDFADIDGKIFAATSNGVFMSTDKGKNWILANQTTADRDVSRLAASGNNLYAGTIDAIYLSTDKGNTWSEINNGLRYPNVFSLTSTGNKVIAGLATGEAFVSDNGINYWSNVYNSYDNHSFHDIIINDNNKFIATDKGVIVCSDSGSDWKAVSRGLEDIEVQCLALSGTNLFAGTRGKGIFLSTNNGKSWDTVNSKLRGIVEDIVAYRGNIFTCTQYEGIYLSTDNGKSWHPENSGFTLLYPGTYSLFIKDDYLYAGTSTGVWMRPLTEMIPGANGAQDNIPAHYMLEQNFPNPVVQTTNISFGLPTGAFVTLKVYDASGKEVAILLSGELPAGMHSCQWDASGLPDGSYFYCLDAGDFSETKTLVIMR